MGAAVAVCDVFFAEVPIGAWGRFAWYGST